VAILARRWGGCPHRDRPTSREARAVQGLSATEADEFAFMSDREPERVRENELIPVLRDPDAAGPFDRNEVLV